MGIYSIYIFPSTLLVLIEFYSRIEHIETKYCVNNK